MIVTGLQIARVKESVVRRMMQQGIYDPALDTIAWIGTETPASFEVKRKEALRQMHEVDFFAELAALEKTKGHTHHGAALLSPNPEINREETRELSQKDHHNTTGADDEGTCYD